MYELSIPHTWTFIYLALYITSVHVPDKLAEGFVVSQRAVVFLGEDVVNILHAPVIQQLRWRLWLLQKQKYKNKLLKSNKKQMDTNENTR